MGPGTIRSILLNHLKTETTLPEVTSENLNYQAKNRVPFTRFGMEPRETFIRSTLAPNPIQEFGGLVRVSLFRPRGAGVDDLYADADKVLGKFPPSTFLTVGDDSVHILASWAETVIEDPDWVFLPVFVRYLAFEQTTA